MAARDQELRAPHFPRFSKVYSMSPIRAIKDWYVSLDNELQSDIAYMFVSSSLGDRQFAPPAAVRRLLQWFDVRSAGTEHEDISCRHVSGLARIYVCRPFHGRWVDPSGV